MGILNVGISGLVASQYGLMTTGHNISNANTEGYTRQTTVQATNIAMGTGAGYVGQGTHVSSIQRAYNSFLNDQVSQTSTQISNLDAYYNQVVQIDNLLADKNAGLSPALQDFFKAVQAVAANPTMAASRQSLVSASQALSARFQSLDKRLTDMYGGVNGQISSNVDLINSYSQQIAQVNQRIIVAQSATNQPANDLLDQRDQLIANLNKIVRATTSTDADGSVSVFIGNGQQLVVGANVTKLQAVPSNGDPQRITVAIETPQGNVEMPESLLTGGALGGLLQFRSQSLDKAVDSLGQVAGSLAMTFNAQHAIGQDQLGNRVGDTNFIADFFQISGPKTIPSANNKGTGTVGVNLLPPTYDGTNYETSLSNSSYKLTFDGGNYTLTRSGDGKTWGPADLASLNTQITGEGFEFDTATLPAGAQIGDSYSIQPSRELARNFKVNSAIVADPRLFAAALPVSTAKTEGNLGSGAVEMVNVTAGYTLPAAGSPDVITFSGGMLNGPGGSVAYNPQGTTYSYNGITIKVSGVPEEGDTFTISQNANGTGDNTNAVLLGKLQTQNTSVGGTTSYQGAYAQLVSNIGNKTREIAVTRDAQQTLYDQASAAREAVSGVNLDEEAANLIKFQTAYQASARMMNIGSKLFDVLFSIGQ